MVDYIKIGAIVSVHGINGEVKIYPITDNPDRFMDLDYVFIGKDESEPVRYDVKKVRIYNGFPLVQFKSVNDRNAAELLREYNIYVDRENTVKLPEGRYLICDLINSDIYEDDKKIGVLTDVLQTGANDVYVVKELNGNELLLPVIKDCILNVDIQNNRIDVHVMEGLRDDPI
ncbi:MAG TPA: 16S rRNA processing protein RimM [Clostridiales bacterium]|nr:16S rRNA processing protein RimM [Clostridiales bacterium]